MNNHDIFLFMIIFLSLYLQEGEGNIFIQILGGMILYRAEPSHLKTKFCTTVDLEKRLKNNSLAPEKDNILLFTASKQALVL